MRLNQTSFRNHAPRIQSAHAVRDDMDCLLRLELTPRKRYLYAPSEHLGPGFDSCRRVYRRSNDCCLKASSKKLRYSRKIINRGKWDIQVAKAKDAVHEDDIHSFFSNEF